MRRAVLLAGLATLVAAPPAHGAEFVVDMPGKFFEPSRLEALVGDTVTWTNSDFTGHDVAALDASFDSGLLGNGERFSQTFARPGAVPYQCKIHHFMTGQVDVFAFALRAPSAPVSVGERAVLRGAAPGGARTVVIEQQAPDGSFRPLTTVPVASNGTFRATVVPTAPTVYRAVAGALPSLPLALRAGARLELGVRRDGRGRVAVHAAAAPAQAGAAAALQLYSRERFSWRQVAHRPLDARSSVTFAVRAQARRVKARVVLLSGLGGYGPAVSRPVVIGPA